MHCVKAFQETPGPVRVFDTTAKPLELFQLFYTEEIFRHIVQCTNDNAHRKRTADPESHKCTWTPVDVNDIKTYYGVLIMCDILKLDSANRKAFYVRYQCTHSHHKRQILHDTQIPAL